MSGVATLSRRCRARQQVVGLEDEADALAAQRGQTVIVEAATSVPARWYVPEDGRSRQPMTCMSVDLPEPDGPTMATNSPSRTWMSTPASACTWVRPVS